MPTRYENPRPTVVSSVLAVAVAAGVVAAVAGPDVAVERWLGLELVGLAVLAAGAVGYRRGRRVVGVVGALVGVAVSGGAVAGFLGEPLPTSELLRVLPGLLGVAVLAAALVPVRGEGSRLLVKAGAGGVFAAVVLAGLFQTTGLPVLLGTAVGSVVAWDAGDHAIGVGQQLGRRATTWRGEVTHVVGTAVVGVAGVVAVVAARSVADDGLSLTAFALVFLALVLLAAALRW